MPKGKNRKGNMKLPELPITNGNRWETSSDDSNVDNASIISIASDSRSLYEDPAYDVQEVDDQSSKEDLEMRVSEAIDGCTQKSAKGRQTSLDSVRKAICTQSIFDFISQRKMTINDAVERSLKKGKGAEQAAAAKLASVLSITLGSYENDVDDILVTLHPLLIIILNDYSMSAQARSECASTLGLCIFIASGEKETLLSTMDALQSIFSASFLKGNGTIQNHSPEVTALHTAALLAWCLILTLFPFSKVYQMTQSSVVKRIPELLQSPDVELRITAGETIAVIHEMARSHDENYEMDDADELCETLKQLATDSNKYRAKKDRRQQRSSFRDILRAVQDDDYPEIQVKFGQEIVCIDTWCKKRQYDSFCAALGPGMNLHLAENELIRDVFELGPPLTPNSITGSKISKLERHLVNVASFKARTKARSKVRDKRSAVFP